MKKIGIVIQHLSSGGAERQAAFLAELLSTSYEVFLICSSLDNANKYNKSIIENSKIKIIQVGEKNVFSSVYEVLKSNNIKIGFSYLLWGNFYLGLAGSLAGVKYRIGGIRNSKLDSGKIFINKFLHNWINTKTIYNNFKGKDLLCSQGFNEGRTIVIPNVKQVNNKNIVRKQKEDINILSVGRFVLQKDIYTGLNAVRNIHKSNKNITYTIIGYGELEIMIKYHIATNGMENYVNVVIDPPDIENYYKRADIYLQTSLFEGLSNTVLEAMSFSLPCVVTDVGDNAKLIDENMGGYLTQVKDLDGIINNLNNLISSYEKRIEFGSHNYNKIKNEYSEVKFKERYINLIESFLESKKQVKIKDKPQISLNKY